MRLGGRDARRPRDGIRASSRRQRSKSVARWRDDARPAAGRVPRAGWCASAAPTDRGAAAAKSHRRTDDARRRQRAACVRADSSSSTRNTAHGRSLRRCQPRRSRRCTVGRAMKRAAARRGRAPSAPARPPHVRPRVVRPRHSRARHLRGHSTRARRGHALATSASRRLLRRGGRRGYPREDRASHQPPVPRLRDPPRRRRVARALVVRAPRRVGLGPKQVPSGGVRRRGLRRGVFPAHAQAPEKRLRIPQDDPEGGATRHARTDGALHRKFHLQAAHVRGGGRDGGERAKINALADGGTRGTTRNACGTRRRTITRSSRCPCSKGRAS